MNASNKVSAHFEVTELKNTKAAVARMFNVSPRTIGRWIDEVEAKRKQAKEIKAAVKIAVEPIKQEEIVMARPVKKVAVVYHAKGRNKQRTIASEVVEMRTNTKPKNRFVNETSAMWLALQSVGLAK